ncbi:unnamed protein product [Rodentolepis nana]|uniref:Innexin n=1 Tax=Rodentolepis nana TaxID=102285 RepID=A0A0R3TWI3_RODNA|nr:unnamed protein product [Rodentolepis nana]
MAVNLVGGLENTFSKRHGSQNDQFATLEDFGDRLNRFYTSTVLLILVGVTVTNVYFLKSISCNLSHIPSSPGFVAYTESVCWVQGTIGLDKTDKIPGNETEWNRLRENSDMSFYQWVPFCLTVQAILFYIPHLIWQAMSINTLGDNFNHLVARAKSVNTSSDVVSRSKLLQTCAYQLNLLTLQHTDRRHSSWAKFQRSVNRRVPLFFAKRLGNRTAMYYLLTKILYIINCVGQIYLIMYFIAPNTETRSSLITFSMRLFNTTRSQKEWGGSDLFPLQTLCPIRIPELGKRDQLYTAICALPVNMLNVKIYMFLWVWILAVFVVSVISTLIWMSRLLVSPLNKAFLSNFLEVSLFAANSMASDDESKALTKCSGERWREDAQQFYEEVVGLDGTFLIRMLRLNAGDVVAGEILMRICEMFNFGRGGSRGFRVNSMVILEDFSDRLNSKYTSAILLLLSAITMVKVYFVRPISCDIQGLPKEAANYVESVCWNQGTLNWRTISEVQGSNRSTDTSFYQRVPVWLIIQAILFYLPHFTWHALLNWSFGENLRYLLSRAKAAAMTEDVLSRARMVRACADQLYLLSRQNFNTITCPCSMLEDYHGAFQTCRHACNMVGRVRNKSAICYLFVKSLYILNGILQVFLAACLLSQDTLVHSVTMGYNSRFFPHTGVCTLRLPSLGVRSRLYTVSCALPVNVFYENVYFFLWLWIMGVLFVSIITAFTWLCRLLMPYHRNNFIRTLLHVSLLKPPSFRVSDATDLDILAGRAYYEAAILDGALVERFLTDVVGCDGSFIIRVVRLNAGDIVTGEILVTWYRMFMGVGRIGGDGEAIYLNPVNLQLSAVNNVYVQRD